MNGNWIAVASAEHVERGIAGGFMQVCHGKAAPLRRIAAGDRVVYYSPTATFGGKDRLQAFTAFGVVKAGGPYRVEMAPNFHPFRHDVTWLKARAAPVRPLLDELEFTAGQRNWGYAFRPGLVAVSIQDMDRIVRAMTPERLAAPVSDFLCPPAGKASVP